MVKQRGGNAYSRTNPSFRLCHKIQLLKEGRKRGALGITSV